MAAGNGIFDVLLLALLLGLPCAYAINFTQCANDARSVFLQLPNSSFLVQQDGSYTSNISDARGMQYERCNRLCGPRGSWEPFDWAFFSSSFSSWLLPYLAVTAQLPFETKDTPSDIMVLFLAVGSPMLLAYSLTLTVLNTRWINHAFRQLKEMNKQVGGKQLEAIEAARRCLIESQHIPIQNRVWWTDLDTKLRKIKRPWTYPLFAQLFWVFFAQLLAVIDFVETAPTNSIVGLGLAINSMWIWMIPVKIGWVCVGRQTLAGTFKAATMTINPPDTGRIVRQQDGSTGLRDRTAFAVAFWQDHDEEGGTATFPSLSTVTTVQNYERKDSKRECLDEVTADNTENREKPSSTMRKTFLSLTTMGYEYEPGPIFNFARFWTFNNTATYLLRGFGELNSKLACDPPKTVSGDLWDYDD